MRQQRKNLIRQIALEIEDAVPLWVCQNCLDDYMLKMLMTITLQKKRLCSSCNTLVLNALAPERIARFIRNDLKTHFQIDYGLYPGYELTLDKVVSRAIGCSSDTVCRAISVILEEPDANENEFYWPGQEYSCTSNPFESEEQQRHYVTGTWENIANELTHGRRFFNETARSYFESLIMEATEAEHVDHPGVPAVITILDTDAAFYRSRIASDEAQARSFAENADIELGAAPKERAANNRMSPAGVPLLYVSQEVETSIAEIRPSIGDLVVVGCFRSTASLKFFDFTKLSHRLRHTALSLFDPEYEKRREHRMMLEYLHDIIARPVRAGDLEYVVTQALAEFIRYDTKWAFDGIAFRSVQRQGRVNYALFDRGSSEAMLAADWRPIFQLTITTEGISLHTIESVLYNHKIKE